MSDEKPVEEEVEESGPGGPTETAAADKEVLLEDLKPQLYRMIYNQPTILFSILEVLFELLENRGVMRPGEADILIREGIRRWTDEVGSKEG